MHIPPVFLDMAVLSALKAFRASRSTLQTFLCAQKIPAVTDFIKVERKTDQNLEIISSRLSGFEKIILSLLRWEFDQSISWEASEELARAFMSSQAKKICRSESFCTAYSKQTCLNLTYKEFWKKIDTLWAHLELLFDDSETLQ